MRHAALVLACSVALLSGCRTPLVLGHGGPVLTTEPVQPSPETVLPACCPVSWACGPERGRRLRRWRIELEAGPVWQSRNDAAIPGDTGTRFALDDVTGAGPFAYGRVTVDVQLAQRHSLRALVAPLELSGTGVLDRAVSFRGSMFAAGVPTQATYRFNSYRLTYRYLLGCGCDWSLHVGATAKIRDAKIALEQGGLRETKYDLGFVPLLHASFEKRLAPRWRVLADADFAAAPQGRAIDFSAKLYYDVDDRWSVGLGYRTIEGGADNDAVYTFAWFHQAVFSVAARF